MTTGEARKLLLDAVILLRDGKITVDESKAIVAKSRAYNKTLRAKIKAVKKDLEDAMALKKRQTKKTNNYIKENILSKDEDED